MLKIRLARVGKKKQPTYRFIVSEAARDTYGKALEILGHYNPFSKVVEVNKERILYWISKGAQVSPTVHNLLVDQKVISGEKVRASKGRKKRKKGKSASAEASSSTKVSEDKSADKGGKPAEGEVVEAKPEKAKEEPKVEEKAEEVKEEKSKKEDVKEEKPVKAPAEDKEEKAEEKEKEKAESEAKPEKKKK